MEFDLLRKIFFESKARVLFITGAGVSLKSGIPLYRSGTRTSATTSEEEPIVVVSGSGNLDDEKTRNLPKSGAIWERKLEVLCQKRSFLADPRSWYTYFWFDSHHVDEFLNAAPNEAHYAIGYLCSKYQGRIRLVTQNVDMLHDKAMCPRSSCIEIHGRLGLYRCCRNDCKFGHLEPITPDTMDFMTAEEESAWQRRNALSPTFISEIETIFEKEKARGTVSKIKKDFRLPCCPSCRSPAIPLTLMFDETYQTHSYFSFEKFQFWLREADVIIFMGTSFSVFCTHLAISICRKLGKTVFNINPVRDDENFVGFQDISPSPDKNRSLGSEADRDIAHFEFNWSSDDSDEDRPAPKNKTSDNITYPKICHIQLKADEALMECMIPSVQSLIAAQIEKVRDEKERSIWRAL